MAALGAKLLLPAHNVPVADPPTFLVCLRP